MSMRCNTCQVEFPIEERHKHFSSREHALCGTENEILRLLDEFSWYVPKHKAIVRKLKEDVEDTFQQLAREAHFKVKRPKKKSRGKDDNAGWKNWAKSNKSEEIEDMVLANVEPRHIEEYKCGKLKYSWQRR